MCSLYTAIIPSTMEAEGLDINPTLIFKNKILAASQPLEDIIIENYASTLPKYLGMFVKQANKATLLETFKEAIKVEKNI